MNRGSTDVSMVDDGVQSLIDASPDHVAILDADGRIVATNRHWNAFSAANGGADEAYFGDNYLSVCARAAQNGDTAAALVLDGLRSALSTGEFYRSEYPCDSPGEKRWFEVTASPFAHRSARHLVVTHRNVTRAKMALELEHDFAFVAHASALGTWANIDAVVICGRRGEILLWSNGAAEMFGYSAQEAMLKPISMLYPDADDAPPPVAGATPPEQVVAWDAVCAAKDGRRIPTQAHATPLRNAQGDIYAALVMHRDMTGYAETLNRSIDANRELAHRLKNLLTVVQSLFSQTARRSADIPTVVERFSRRIEGLSRSVDLLMESGGGAVPLKEIVRRHLEAFVQPDDPRVALDVGDVAIGSDAVHALGMALHELATNATKYGGLSVPDGHVVIALDLAAPRPRLVWTETASTIVGGPASPGFGSSVLTRMSERVLGGKTRYERVGGSLTWTVEIDRHLIAA